MNLIFLRAPKTTFSKVLEELSAQRDVTHATQGFAHTAAKIEAQFSKVLLHLLDSVPVNPKSNVALQRLSVPVIAR